MIECGSQRIQPTMQPGSGIYTLPKVAADGSAGAAPAARDAVELSDKARDRASTTEVRPVRAELIQRVRAEIADGTYLTDEKIDAVIDRLHRELFIE